MHNLSAADAANMIKNGERVGFSGFTPAGSVKAIPRALGERAVREHAEGRELKIGVFTGASTGDSLDGSLARADAVFLRAPYQTNKDFRNHVNAEKTDFFDLHLSLMPQFVRYGFLGKIDWAIVEAVSVSADGKIVPTTSVGTSPTFCRMADKILVEINDYHPTALEGLHDIYECDVPPNRREIPLYQPKERIGKPFIHVDPRKIVGVVRNNAPDETAGFTPTDEVRNGIGENVAEFFAREMAEGRIPKSFLPVQSGVGNVANAVLGAMGSHAQIPVFTMFSEVIQDSVIELIEQGHIDFASGTSLTVSKDTLVRIYANLAAFKKQLILRPQEITNSPELIRRLGILSINTAIEVDIYGNVNSSHFFGSKLMNGIGGSGDFTRNAYISTFTCPSTAKDGAISSIVPFCSHIDHSEHSVQVIVTEQGIADLRGKSPRQRAQAIIENCAHPDFRPRLRDYLKNGKGHIPHDLSKAFSFHLDYLKTLEK
ncbi:MAG: acetyl-CoA hydrolase [Verrucomicrobia bacterium GWF2_51_19]|nr:MAG: acetyl-CoA hydrolase [Verrucomicrobia bacterium GWF2_51_19]HCJ11489.1 acetyl-CoA hydrolase [Opitutae bacterium]